MLPPLPGATDRRIDSLLTLLADNPMLVISGAKIAREIGVSRTSVWRWVQMLRSLGVRVKGHKRSGYQLDRIPDALMPQMLRRCLHGTPFARRIHHFFKVDSTNNAALHLAHAGEPHGSLVIAEEQTAGRGRTGRPWHSEKSSGIYLTVLLRPPLVPAQAPLLTLLAGLAIRDAVVEQTGLYPDLRWPNDLLLRGHKFCGVLTEMHAEPDRVHFVIVGIGLNVNHARVPEALAPIATSLRMESGRVHSRLDLLVKLLRWLDRYYNQFLEEGAAAIVERFAAVSSFASGKRVRIAAAGQSYEGVTAGLDPSGVLRVTRDDGQTALVIAGDVSEAS